jgi:hypothetical protein
LIFKSFAMTPGIVPPTDGSMLNVSMLEGCVTAQVFMIAPVTVAVAVIVPAELPFQLIVIWRFPLVYEPAARIDEAVVNNEI